MAAEPPPKHARFAPSDLSTADYLLRENVSALDDWKRLVVAQWVNCATPRNFGILAAQVRYKLMERLQFPKRETVEEMGALVDILVGVFHLAPEHRAEIIGEFIDTTYVAIAFLESEPDFRSLRRRTIKVAIDQITRKLSKDEQTALNEFYSTSDATELQRTQVQNFGFAQTMARHVYLKTEEIGDLGLSNSGLHWRKIAAVCVEANRALLACYKEPTGVTFATLEDQCIKIADAIGGLKDPALDWDVLRKKVITKLLADMPNAEKNVHARLMSLMPTAGVRLR